MRRFLLLALFPLVFTSGCARAGESPSASAQTASSTQENESLLHFKGTVVHVPLEGGFFGILTEDGTKYDPRNLPEEFRQDGLPVEVTAEAPKGVIGFHMWGRIVDIVKIERQ